MLYSCITYKGDGKMENKETTTLLNSRVKEGDKEQFVELAKQMKITQHELFTKVMNMFLKIRGLEKITEDRKAQAEELQTILDRILDIFGDLLTSNENLKESMKETHIKELADRNKKIVELKEKVDVLKEKDKALEKENTDYWSRNRELEKEIDDIRTAKNEMELKNKEIMTLKDAAIQEGRGKIEKLNDLIASLTAKLDESKQYKDKIIDLEKVLKNKDEKLITKEIEKKGHIEQIDFYKSQMNSLKEDYKAQINALKTEYKEEIKNIKIEYNNEFGKAREEHKKELEEVKVTLRKECDNRVNEIKEIEAERIREINEKVRQLTKNSK